MDIVSHEKRSRMMAGIRSKNTRPEILVRKALHALGFRYRLHNRKLPGKPDLVLKKHNALIFIHGCFWHGHDCHLFILPKTRTEFWQHKIQTNRERDTQVMQELEQQGWRIATVWECALKGKKRMKYQELIQKLAQWILSDENSITLEGEIN